MVATSTPSEYIFEPPPLTVVPSRSIRSPPRSPRLAGLLLALKGVIGEDTNDEYESEDEDTIFQQSTVPSNNPNTPEDHTTVNSIHSLLINSDGGLAPVDSSGSPSIGIFKFVRDNDDENSCTSHPLNEPETNGQTFIHSIPNTPDQNPIHPSASFNLLSPVDLSHLNLVSFNHEFYVPTGNDRRSIESGYADTRNSSPRSPLKSAFSLLSSPSTASSRILSSQPGVFVDRPPQSHAVIETSPEIIADPPGKGLLLDLQTPEASEEYVVLGDDGYSSCPSPTLAVHCKSGCEEQEEMMVAGQCSLISSWASEEHIVVDVASSVATLNHDEANCEGRDNEEQATNHPLFASTWGTQGQPSNIEDVQDSYEEQVSLQYHSPSTQEVERRLSGFGDASPTPALFPPVHGEDDVDQSASTPTWGEVGRRVTGSGDANIRPARTCHAGSDCEEQEERDEIKNEHPFVSTGDESSGLGSPTLLTRSDVIYDEQGEGSTDQYISTSISEIGTQPLVFENISSRSLSTPLDHVFDGEGGDEGVADQYASTSAWDGRRQSLVIRNSTPVSSVPGNGLYEDQDEEVTDRCSWEIEGQLTAVYLRISPPPPDEIRAAVQRSSWTPSHFLTNEVEFMDDEPVGISSLVDSSHASSFESPGSLQLVDDALEDTDRIELTAPMEFLDHKSVGDPPLIDLYDNSFNGGSPEHPELDSNVLERGSDADETAQISYLSAAVVNENDTISCIYAEYSELSGDSTESSETSLQTVPDAMPLKDVKGKYPFSGTSPSISGLIRERVFTPPPSGEHLRTIIPSAGSHASIPSPPVSFRSLSRERVSSRSLARSAWSPDSSDSDSQEVPPSQKIPFGFRKSLAIGGMSRRFQAIGRLPPKSSQSERAFSPQPLSPVIPRTPGLRPLRLSALLASKPSSAPFHTSKFPINSFRTSRHTSVSSTNVFNNPLLSSAHTSIIPEYHDNTLLSEDPSSPLSSRYLSHLANLDEPYSAPLSRPAIWQSDGGELTQTTLRYNRPISRFSEPSFTYEEESEDQDDTTYDHTIRRTLPVVPRTAPLSRAVSINPPMYPIATPKPTLMFAIASDNVQQVREVLERGDAGPNDPVGPQSALAFALTNDQLVHKMEIVKILLAFDADPKVATATEKGATSGKLEDAVNTSPLKALMTTMDPATRYYVERADASHTRRTSALIHRSFFRPLTRVRYELIGQDRALEELFKVLSIHSRQLSVTPIVVLLCGPSGHGKSLLARKFGTLLDVPTHTVNMTALNSTQDLWQSYSMSPYEAPTMCTLAEFLINNEGKRCVVVLDEIEKTRDEKTLWSLLMPWELGRCTFEANGRPVDVRNVAWLGTSNVGHDLVFEHHEVRADPDELMSREEYVDLMGLLRPRVSQRLGASILSRVTTVLPFVPFTLDERRAICSEALHTIAADVMRSLSVEIVDKMINSALLDYIAAEGARSLYRAVSNQLVDNI